MGIQIIKKCDRCGKEFITPKNDIPEDKHNTYREFTNNTVRSASMPCSIESQMRAAEAWKKIGTIGTKSEKKYCFKCSIIKGIKEKFRIDK